MSVGVTFLCQQVYIVWLMYHCLFPEGSGRPTASVETTPAHCPSTACPATSPALPNQRCTVLADRCYSPSFGGTTAHRRQSRYHSCLPSQERACATVRRKELRVCANMV